MINTPSLVLFEDFPEPDVLFFDVLSSVPVFCVGVGVGVDAGVGVGVTSPMSLGWTVIVLIVSFPPRLSTYVRIVVISSSIFHQPELRSDNS